jgi:two-component system, OmpR family, response regulator
MTEKNILLFLVDNDKLFLNSIQNDFKQNTESDVQTFSTGELCLESISQNTDVIILDYHLNSADKKGISGLETLDRIKSIIPETPVIMISSQDKIEEAANCVKHKAYDYILKSETAFLRLQRTIDAILYYNKIEKILRWYMSKM